MWCLAEAGQLLADTPLSTARDLGEWLGLCSDWLAQCMAYTWVQMWRCFVPVKGADQLLRANAEGYPLSGVQLQCCMHLIYRNLPRSPPAVNTIRCSGETLLTLITDILDFSRIEANKMVWEGVPQYAPHVLALHACGSCTTAHAVFPMRKLQAASFSYAVTATAAPLRHPHSPLYTPTAYPHLPCRSCPAPTSGCRRSLRRRWRLRGCTPPRSGCRWLTTSPSRVGALNYYGMHAKWRRLLVPGSLLLMVYEVCVLKTCHTPSPCCSAGCGGGRRAAAAADPAQREQQLIGCLLLDRGFNPLWQAQCSCSRSCSSRVVQKWQAQSRRAAVGCIGSTSLPMTLPLPTNKSVS